jgi:hypothetical protein
MKTIECMATEGSPLVALAQQGAEAADLIISERSAGNLGREPSVGNDRARRAQSEAASLASGDRRLADNDPQQRITQNSDLRETSHERDDLRNVIEDRRCLRAGTPSPPC